MQVTSHGMVLSLSPPHQFLSNLNCFLGDMQNYNQSRVNSLATVLLLVRKGEMVSRNGMFHG